MKLRAACWSNLLVIAALESTPCAAQNWFEGESLALGTYATAHVGGDVNGDGRSDLLVSRFAFPHILPNPNGYLPAIGGGRFGTLVTLPGGSFGAAPRRANLNGDASIDLVAISDPGAIQFWHGRPDGGFDFQPPKSISGLPTTVFSKARAFVVVDLDLDGRDDLVLANASNGNLSLFRADGFGGFGPQLDLSLSDGPVQALAADVEVADLNRDGLPDLLAARELSGATGMSVFLAVSPGVFGGARHYGLDSSPDRVGMLATGDLNGDGAFDAALVRGAKVDILLNRGDGHFTLHDSVPADATTPRDIEFGDLDEDGNADLCIGMDDRGVRIAFGLGSGAFAPAVDHPLGFSSGPGGFQVADIDGDTHLDLVCDKGGASVFRGDGRGGIAGPQPLPSFAGVTWVEHGDLDNDGLEDLISLESPPNIGSNTIAVYKRLPGGGFAAPIRTFAGGILNGLALAHIDGDGKLDVVVTDLASFNLPPARALLGDGAGGFGAPILTPLSEHVLYPLLADLNGDQLADLVYAPYEQVFPPKLVLRHGDGTGHFGAPVPLLLAKYPFTVDAVDVDSDGDIDLFVGDAVDNVDILRKNSAGTFSLSSFPMSGGAMSAAVADIDHDGVLDLLAGGRSKLTVRRGLGAGAFAPGVVYLAPGDQAGIFQLQVGDVTGDGRLDVLCHTEFDFISLLVGDAANGFTPGGSYPAGRETYGMHNMTLLDADGDQRLDLVTCRPGLTVRHSRTPRIDPRVYCSAKVNSLGCTPSLAWHGSSSAAASGGFTLSSGRARNREVGLLLHSTSGRSEVRFSGGVLCVRAPIDRSIALYSGGSQTGDDCSGVFSIDMNAFAAGALGGTPSASLSLVGSAVTAQFWGRDPGFAAPRDTSLSAGIEYVVGP